MLEELRRVQQGRCDQRASLGEREARLAAARRFAREAPGEARDLPWAYRRWLLWSRPWLDQVAHAETMLATDHRRAAALRILEQNIADELSKARAAVDAELEEGRGRACIVDTMRTAPNRPSGIREYRDADEFVREDPARALHRWPGVTDAGGMDFGYDWRLEDPVQRWNTTEWRVSWLGSDASTHEVYAIETLSRGHADDARNNGRVWLLGVLPHLEQVHRAIDELDRHAQRERNSLVVVAQAVRHASRAAEVGRLREPRAPPDAVTNH